MAPKRTCMLPSVVRILPNTPRRIEALEVKLNHLLHIAGPLIPSSKSVSPAPLGHVDRRGNPAPLPAIHSLPESSSQARLGKDVIGLGLLTMELASSLLEIFRSTMVFHFPFVLIAPSTTAQELREGRPFLFLAIVAAASFENMPLQRLLGKEVKQVICDRMILGGEVSFELLQGLLVHLAWCQYHSRPRSYTLFLQLAISIIVDLRLDQPLQAKTWKSNAKFRHTKSSSSEPMKTSWNQDEQRAVVGCFYLSSSISMILQKCPTFPHNTYIEDCCISLGEAQEYPTDKLLSCIVRLQKILEKISRLTIQNGSELTRLNSGTQLYITTLKSDLEILKQRIMPYMSESSLLMMQYHTVELYLCQISLLDRDGGLDITRPAEWTSWRLEILCAGLMSAKSLFDSFLSLPWRIEFSFNNSEWVQMGFSLIVASKLSVAASEPSVVRETASFRQSLRMSDVLKQTVLRIGALVTPAVDATGDRDLFYHHEQRIKHVQHWYETNCPKASRPSNLGGNCIAKPPSGTYFQTSLPLDDHTIAGGVQDILAPDSSFDFDGPIYVSDSSIDVIFEEWLSFPMVEF